MQPFGQYQTLVVIARIVRFTIHMSGNQIIWLIKSMPLRRYYELAAESQSILVCSLC